MRLLVYLAVVLGLLATVGAVGLVTADRTIVAGANRFITPPGPEGLIEANNSPAISRNPIQPDNLVAVYRVDRPRFTADLRWSGDGGRTWQSTELPLPAGRDRPYAPDIAFAPDGTLYVTYVNLTGPGNSPQTLWLTTSRDGGRTLSEPVRIAGELTFQPRIAVGPDGTVHVTYLQAEDVGTLRFSGPIRIVAVRSTDRGRTFSQPVRVSDPERERVAAASPAVASNGDLVVVYTDYRDDARDFEGLEGPVWDQPVTLVATRLPQGADTFEESREVDRDVMPVARFVVFLPVFPSVAAGPDGDIYVAWADRRHGDADVMLRRSPDHGRTWAAPVRVNDNQLGDGTDQQIPAVAVAGNGRVDLVYLDGRRHREGELVDVSVATSSDGAASFTQLQVASEPFDPGVGPVAAEFLPPDLGSRLGIASWNDGAVAAWVDTRLGDRDTGRQDIVSSQLDMPPIGKLRTRQNLVIAALVGAAALLVLSQLVSTRREP